MPTIVVGSSTVNGKTFLQMAQEVVIEVLAAGTGPTSVLNQVGEYRRIVKFVCDADQEVQQETDQWRFMVRKFAFDTVAGSAEYFPEALPSPITDLRDWRRRTLKCYLLTGGLGNETPLTFMDYEDWYRLYNTGIQSPTRPVHFTIGNSMEILLGPVPSDVYRISGEYQRAVTPLLADGDMPIYPAEFHMLPVYLAMMKYGRSTAASEVYADAERLYNKMISRMRRSQLARMNTLRPLA